MDERVLRVEKQTRFAFVRCPAGHYALMVREGKTTGTTPGYRLCQIMVVSPRGYRGWRNRRVGVSQRKDLIVLAHIREQSTLLQASYGRPHMTEELKEPSLIVGHRRVGRPMGENGIFMKRNKTFKPTMNSNHSFNLAPNLLDRDFSADRPNQKWAGDISYV